MKDSLVTVIIPVYNVEEYLSRCINSVLRQTYNKLEIIVIDDGSTDNSGYICDEYARIDSRIKVLHTKNGGLSAARNVGLDMAMGEYITCIDSDDYVTEDYIEYLLKILLENDADIATCSFKKIYTELDAVDDVDNEIKIYNTVEALNELLYQRTIVPSAWGKMYKKELFIDVRYPVGMYYEDLATLYKVLIKSRLIATGSEQKYCYLQRSNSIMNEKFNNKKMQRLDVVNELKEYVDKIFPELGVATSTRCFIAGLQVYREIPNFPENAEYIDTAWKQIKKYRWNTLLNNSAKVSTRLMAGSTYLGKRVLNVLGRWYSKVYLK